MGSAFLRRLLLVGSMCAGSTAIALDTGAGGRIEVFDSIDRPEDYLSGLVIGRTVTTMGHAFFRRFSAVWQEQASPAAGNLTVYERPSARWGSMVWVEYERRTVYRAFLRPSVIEAERMASPAARAVQEHLKQDAVRPLFGGDPDLGKEEL